MGTDFEEPKMGAVWIGGGEYDSKSRTGILRNGGGLGFCD